MQASSWIRGPGVLEVTLLREVIEVAPGVEEAFDAVADFSNSASWDPGVLSARRVDDGSPTALGVGAIYDLTVTFRGRSSRMRYTTTRYERPRVIVLEGVGPKIAATDTISFEPSRAGGTTITYTADLRLTGPAKLAAPFLRGAFGQMGRAAVTGMKRWLDASSDAER
jgi:carbon monoxide dehydrogenase subunit G